MVAFAASNSLTIDGTVYLSLTIGGSSKTFTLHTDTLVQNITTSSDNTYFSADMLDGSTIKVISADRLAFEVQSSMSGASWSTDCQSSQSILTANPPSTSIIGSGIARLTITPSSSTCAGGGGGTVSGGGGGGGGGASDTYYQTKPTVVAQAPKTTTAAEQLAALQKQLAALQVQGGATFTALLKLGSTGSQVVALQTILEAKGFLVMPAGVAKGYFGAATRKAVMAYQTSKGLETVGHVGPGTRAALNAESGASAAPTPAPAVAPSAGGAYNFTTRLRVGSEGDAVVSLQTFLEAKGFLVMPAGVAKGYFGAVTRKALQAYQASIGLEQVGELGPATRAAINASQ